MGNVSSRDKVDRQREELLDNIPEGTLGKSEEGVLNLTSGAVYMGSISG